MTDFSMNITGNEILEQARTWIGTPYHHAGRSKGAGVDCIGLVVGAARELGIAVSLDTTAYNRGDNLALMTGGLAHFCDAVPEGDCLSPGDVLIFRGGRILHHVAIYAGQNTNDQHTMIHVYDAAGFVAEVELTDAWMRLLHAVYRYRGNA